MTSDQVKSVCVAAITDLQSKYPDKFASVDQNELLKRAMTIALSESTFNENAKNPKGTAVGLFQIMNSAKLQVEQTYGLQAVSLQDLLDPNLNAWYGIAYYLYQFNRYGDYDKAVIAYNQGHYVQNTAGLAYLRKHLNNYKNEGFSYSETDQSYSELVNFHEDQYWNPALPTPEWG